MVTDFGGGPIDRVLTAGDRVELRVLGKSEVPSLPWRAQILATGNNVAIRGDTARRVLVARLESDLENPEDRTGFLHYPLLPWVEAERVRLVAAALTILRAYVIAGRPDVGVRSWGSFEGWSRVIASALVYAGAADPTSTRPTNDATREPEKLALMAVLAGLPRIDTGRGMTARDIIGTLYSPERLRGQAPPDGHDDLRDAIEALTDTPAGRLPDARTLGNALRKLRGRVVAGKRLDGRPGQAGYLRWAVTT